MNTLEKKIENFVNILGKFQYNFDEFFSKY